MHDQACRAMVCEVVPDTLLLLLDDKHQLGDPVLCMNGLDHLQGYRVVRTQGSHCADLGRLAGTSVELGAAGVVAQVR